MTRYTLHLRGINVSGKNKVVMAKLRSFLQDLGYEEVVSYINSDNLVFSSERSRTDLQSEIVALFASHHPW